MTAPLVFESVSAGYAGRLALAALSAEFPAGLVTGLVGPNGAGKTTLLRTALGLVRTQSGAVVIAGRPQPDWSREALARVIAYLPQGQEAHWPVTAERLVALGRLPHRATLSPLSACDADAVAAALARCDASAFAGRPVDQLSSGERARVLLARALATKAAILLVDEPAAHLDPAHQLRLMELLREEAARGAAVVVTLHDLALAARSCDRIVVLDGGEVAAAGPPTEALGDDVLRRAFGVAAWRPEAFPQDPPPLVPWRRL